MIDLRQVQCLHENPVPSRLAIGPGGVKPTLLAQHGHEVINPKLPDENFDEAVRIAQAEFDQHQPELIVVGICLTLACT